MNKADLLNKAKSQLYIRNYSPRTIASYISSLNNFAEWLIQEKVNQVTDKEVEKYLYHLKKNRNRSISGMKQTVASLKILFTDILKKEIPDSLNIRFRKEEKIPVVLSEEEVAAVIKAVNNLKHKVILMTIYSAGLRLSECLALTVADMDFDRNQIRIRQGKGKKDRQTVLSRTLLSEMKDYLIKFCPKIFLFEGQKGGRYSASSVQAIMKRAVKKSGIKKKPLCIRYVIVLLLIYWKMARTFVSFRNCWGTSVWKPPRSILIFLRLHLTVSKVHWID